MARSAAWHGGASRAAAAAALLLLLQSGAAMLASGHAFPMAFPGTQLQVGPSGRVVQRFPVASHCSTRFAIAIVTMCVSTAYMYCQI